MDLLIEQLKRHEGFRKYVYQCTAGKNTIGYGRNLDDVGIDEEEAEALLFNDIKKARKNLGEHLPWSLTLDPVRFNVLVNMCFNLGLAGLLGFKNTLELVRQHRYEEAADQMLRSKWARQVGNRALELSKQMRTGAYVKV